MLAVITCTSDRPEPFALCKRWGTRAINHFGGPVRWIVVDDGQEPAETSPRQIVIRRPPSESPVKSFLGNLAAGLEAADGAKAIAFLEDDDWYAADYLRHHWGRLANAEISGESRAVYYSPRDSRYWIVGNESHASLGQTVIRGELRRPLLEIIAAADNPFVDIPLWSLPVRKNLEPKTSRHCGMKGMPGKAGFTDGHAGQPQLGVPDPFGVALEHFTARDAEVYRSFAGSGMPC